MNLKKACNIFTINIDELNNISLDELKSKYRAGILKYHPDKSTCDDSNEKFIEIHEAYHFLLKHKQYTEEEEEHISSSDDSIEKEEEYNIKNIFTLFSSSNPYMYQILSKLLVSLWENNSISYLKKLDSTNLMKIHQIIKTHFPNLKVLKTIEKVLAEKTEGIIYLNPNLDDLLEDNIYKLRLDGETYIVPLWHNELVYEHGSNEIIIQCCPILDQNIEIDENNHLYVYVRLNIKDVFDNKNIKVKLTEKRTLEFDSQLLKLTSSPQKIIWYNQGISQINEKSIYDISIKQNIILVVYLYS